MTLIRPGGQGLDAVEKKFGMSQNRETNEKITDGARKELLAPSSALP